MAKKAKLDILEITIDGNNEDKLPDDVIIKEKKDEESDDKCIDGDILSRIKGWMRKPLFWITLISVVMLGLIAGIFISLSDGMDESRPVEKKMQTGSSMPVSVEEKMVLFEGFLVDQKDDKGNTWIVFCDVALELDKPETTKAIDSDRVDVRDVIYTILKEETMKAGLSLEGRAHLKERIKKELNNLFGENQVKNIYFTRYEMN